MRTRKTWGIAVALLAVGLLTPPCGHAVQVGTTFTYQGRLTDGDVPADGGYDFQFTLHTCDLTGAQVGPTVALDNVAVEDGVFSVQLDFGSVFTGEARCLEVGVRPGSASGGDPYTVIEPRQVLYAAPHALYALSAGGAPWSGLTGVPGGFLDGVDDDTAYTGGSGLTLIDNQFRVNFAGNGIAPTAARSDHQHDGAYWKLSGNTGTTPGADFLGTVDNRAFQLHVGNARALRVEPGAVSPNLIGGYNGNSVDPDVHGATITGGGGGLEANRVTDDYGTVSGGLANRAGNAAGSSGDRSYATVGGGRGNVASGSWATVAGGSGNLATNASATVGGGGSNAARGIFATAAGGSEGQANGDYSTVGGGSSNEADGANATVSGGYDNLATGDFATVPGGGRNSASANYSLAAGRRAKAVHAGAFVWADSTDADFSSTSADQLSVRASNGVRLSVNAGPDKAIHPGEDYRDNAVAAWAKVRVAANQASLQEEFGVASVVRNGAGNYTINVNAVAGSADRLIPVAVAEVDGPPAAAADLRIVSVDQVDGDTFRVFINRGTGPLVDNDFIFLATAR